MTRVLCAIALSALLCGCGGGGGTATLPATSSLRLTQGAAAEAGRLKEALYAANGADNSVTVYDTSASGDEKPLRRIAGSSTLLSYPSSLALDGNGTLWALSSTAGGARFVTAYAPGARGNARPIHQFSIAMSAPCPRGYPGGGACAFTGQYLAVSADGSSLVVFGHLAFLLTVVTFSTTTGAQGHVFYSAGSRGTPWFAQGIAFTSQGDLILASSVDNGRTRSFYSDVAVYDAAASSDNPNGIAPSIRNDASGNVGTGPRLISGFAYRSGEYALTLAPVFTYSGVPAVLVYNEGSSNALLQDIEGTSALLDPTPFRPGYIVPIALDAAGTVYVGRAANTANVINVYAKSQTGNVAPIRRISGPRTGLNALAALAIGPRGESASHDDRDGEDTGKEQGNQAQTPDY